MDLTDQRLACLRMAMDLKCDTEPLLKAANELMSFIATGALPAVPEAAKAEPAIDTIAACGTAMEMADGAGLEAAQPITQVEAGAGETAIAAAATKPAEVAVGEEDGAGPSADAVDTAVEAEDRDEFDEAPQMNAEASAESETVSEAASDTADAPAVETLTTDATPEEPAAAVH